MKTSFISRLCKPICIQIKDSSFREKNFWALIFSNNPKAQEINQSMASRYLTGTRTINPTYANFYHDLDNPACPAKLYKSIFDAIYYHFPDLGKQTKLYNQLITFCYSCVPPVDRVELLPEQCLAGPSRKDIAELWTALLWYSICNDIACVPVWEGDACA